MCEHVAVAGMDLYCPEGQRDVLQINLGATPYDRSISNRTEPKAARHGQTSQEQVAPLKAN